MNRFGASVEVKARVSVGIFGCEASLEVTTGFSYDQTIETEVTETFKETLAGPAEYWTYQSCLYYCLRYEGQSNKSGVRYHYIGLEIQAHVYRDTPTVVNVAIEPYSRDDFENYLWRQSSLLGISFPPGEPGFRFDPPITS
jgi:hypothetical protein